MDSDRKIIFMVDDNGTNLTAGKDILKNRYKVYPMASGQVLFEVLEKVRPDMILLDIEMPDMNGHEAFKKLKGCPQWADIPVIFLTAKTDKASEEHGLSLGAVDYITKPFVALDLVERIEKHLLPS